MKLVIFFMNEPLFLDELLSAFVEIGIPGATIIDSMGMGRILTTDVPIFAGLRDIFPGSSPDNRLIFIVVEDDRVNDIVTVIEDVCGSLDDPSVGILISLPVDFVKGFKNYYK